MSQFDIAEAKASFSELVKRAMMGEDVVIAKDGKPVIRFVPVALGSVRTPGSAQGEFQISADFDEPLADFEEYV